MQHHFFGEAVHHFRLQAVAFVIHMIHREEPVGDPHAQRIDGHIAGRFGIHVQLLCLRSSAAPVKAKNKNSCFSIVQA